MRNRLSIIVGAVLGLVAVVLVHNYLDEQRRKIARLTVGLDPTPVLVAKHDIDAEQILAADMLELQQAPAKFLQPYAESDPRQVIGKRASVHIAKGEQVLRTKLELPTAGSTMAGKTPTGKRAVTISMDPIAAVGGFLRPGDTVDVLWITSVPGPGGGNQPMTVTLFQSVKILAVGDQLSEVPERRKRGDNEPQPTNVTVALSPEEAQLLLVAQEQGKLQLALRSRADLEAVALGAAQPESLLRRVFPPEAFQTPQDHSKQVEVFRGLEKEVVAVSR